MVRPQPLRATLSVSPRHPVACSRNGQGERGAQKRTAPRLAEFPVYLEMARDPNSPNRPPRSANPAPDDNSAKKIPSPEDREGFRKAHTVRKGRRQLQGEGGLTARRLTPRARRCRSIPRQTC